MPLIVTFMEFLAGFCFPLGVRVCMFVYKKKSHLFLHMQMETVFIL